MRFTDNASITTANMAQDDILAGTDVSAGTDKKFTLANLASWILDKFTGLTLGGIAQSVKAAIDEVSSKATRNDLNRKALPAKTSLLDLTLEAGNYYAPISEDAPTSNKSGYLTVTYRANTVDTIRMHIWQPYNTDEQFVNMRKNNSEWSGWIKYPTRAEFNALADISTGHLTLVSGVSGITIHSANYIARQGETVTATIRLQPVTFGTANTQIAVLDNDSDVNVRPTTITYAPIVTSTGATGQINIDTAGRVYLKLNEAIENGYVMANMSWTRRS